jgi:hypothetical protein
VGDPGVLADAEPVVGVRIEEVEGGGETRAARRADAEGVVADSRQARRAPNGQAGRFRRVPGPTRAQPRPGSDEPVTTGLIAEDRSVLSVMRRARARRPLMFDCPVFQPEPGLEGALTLPEADDPRAAEEAVEAVR